MPVHKDNKHEAGVSKQRDKIDKKQKHFIVSNVRYTRQTSDVEVRWNRNIPVFSENKIHG